MCDLFKTIKLLIENSKLKEAIVKLEAESVGRLAKFMATIISLNAALNDLETKINNGLLTAEEAKVERAKISSRIINTASKICSFNITTDDIAPYIDSALVMRDSFPFIDRTRFRRKIKKAILSEGPKIIFVEGPSKSGMSYLEKFLKNLTHQLELYSLVSMHIPEVLYGADIVLGEKLAKSILNKLGLGDLEFDQDENEQFKFTQFVNRLKTKLNNEEKIPIFFLHDFHKIEEDNDNLLEFIFALIKEIDDSFPKCILVIAGLNYRNIRSWQNELKFIPTTQTYTIESIEVEHIKTCLGIIFGSFIMKKYMSFIKKGVEMAMLHR